MAIEKSLIELRNRQSLLARLIAVLTCALAIVSVAEGQCKGPEGLEAKIQAGAAADTLTELGTWFADQKQFECAAQAFQSALKMDPASAKLNYFLGLSLYSSGQVEAAVSPLERSTQLDTKAIPPRLVLAAVLHQLNRRSDAEAQWQAVLQLDPASKDALDGLANSLIDGGDTNLAIQLLLPVKRDEDLTLDLARAYGLAGMLDNAAKTVQEALALDPSSLRLTNALTTVYVQQHRYQDAAALTRDYLQQHPDDTDAQIAYLSALVLNNDAETARPIGRKLLKSAPHDFNVLYLNGILEREAGEYAAAREHLQEAVKIQPDNYSVRFNLGTALAHLNETNGAKQQLERAIELDPSQSQAHFQLAGVLRTLGDTAGAQQQLAIYKQLSDASTALSQATTRAQLAAEKMASGDAKQAALLYKQAVEATPKDAMLQYQLSVALDKTGDTDGERAALEQAVTIDPTFALAQNQLGYLSTRAGDATAAEKHFRAAVNAAPAFTEAWINLGATLAQQGRLTEAQQAVATALQLDPKNAHAIELNLKLGEVTHH
jgi:Flp pilus assembly protein TadD